MRSDMDAGVVKQLKGPPEEEHVFDHLLSSRVAFCARHLSEEIKGVKLYEEKHQKEKTKTGASALVVCLNLDIDPPDVNKIPPYSRVEAWFDPTDANSLRALETIGKNLQAQYERWQPRARFKQCLDPTSDDVKNLCISLRRNFKNDRILFHYNGHGVPRPTEKGEIWVFNTKFTKYIPLSLYDLQRWVGAPAIYVIDCQNAGRVVRMYEEFCRRAVEANAAADTNQRQVGLSAGASDARHAAVPGPLLDPNRTDRHTTHPAATGGNATPGQSQTSNPQSANPQPGGGGTVPVLMENTIMLAACQESEDLPQTPDLPADVFTACLTTPIRMALRWHWICHQDYFPGQFDEALLDRIPGAHSNRMSLLGEINWIFTAVTDTIAWCSFPIDLFQKLFRQDLLVAGLFRNFLLAERIMKVYGCSPVSAPALPPTFRHPMWNTWDHALDRLFHYLPRIIKMMETSPTTELQLPIILPSGTPQPILKSHPPSSTANALAQANEAIAGQRLGQPGHTQADRGLTTNRAPRASNADASDKPARPGQQQQEESTNRPTHPNHPQVPARPEVTTAANLVPPGFLGDPPHDPSRRMLTVTSTQRPIPCNPAKVTPLVSDAVPSTRVRHPAQDARGDPVTRSSAVIEGAPVKDKKGGGGAPEPTRSEQVSHKRSGHQTDDPKPTEVLSRRSSRKRSSSSLNGMPQGSRDCQAHHRGAAEDGVGEDEDDDDDDDDDEDEEDVDESDDDEVTDDDSDISDSDVGGSASAQGSAKLSNHANHPSSKTARVKVVKPSGVQSKTITRRRASCPELYFLPSNRPKPRAPTTSAAQRQLMNRVVCGNKEPALTKEATAAATTNEPVPPPTAQPPTCKPSALPKIQENLEQEVSTDTRAPPPQPTGARLDPTQASAMRRHPHALDKLYALQAPEGVRPTGQANGTKKPEAPPVQTNAPAPPSKPGGTMRPPGPQPTSAAAAATGTVPTPSAGGNSRAQPSAVPPSDPPVYSGSVIGGCGPSAFFTSQMTAFKVWLQTANEHQPPATQLPILLQILLSQSHRTRAMKLLSEFLDLGPWAVTHCLMVGILPYIVRLFSSSLLEVKPHLVFIWGKIIASAQTEFSRNDSVRDVGYKYFINCLGDTENLSALTRTITAFALTKMLEKEPGGEPDTVFQDISLKQNFIPLVLSQLYDNPPEATDEIQIRLRQWLIFSLAKLWRRNDQARWFGVRYNVTEVLFAYLDDISPEVRATTVYALGTLVDNQTVDASKQDHADQISQLVCARLIRLATSEASPLVRCELLAALSGLVCQFEGQLCAMAHQYLLELYNPTSAAAAASNRVGPLRPQRHSVVGSSGIGTRTATSTRQEDRLITSTQSTQSPPSSVRRKRSDVNASHTFFAGTTNVYAQFWLALVALFNDPHPDVARRGRVVVHYVLAKSSEKFGLLFPVATANSTGTAPPSSTAAGDSSTAPSQHRSTPPTTTSLTDSSTAPTPEIPSTTGLQRPLASFHLTTGSSVDQSVAARSASTSPRPSTTGPVPTLAPHATDETKSTSCSPMLPHPVSQQNRTSHALTSTFFLHSAQFPGRRHQQVDQLVRKPSVTTQPSPDFTHPATARLTTEATGGGSVDENPLDHIRRTQFFAWSCRWFTRPLLASCHPDRTAKQRLSSSQNESTSRPPSSSAASALDTHRPRSPTPDPQLIALCSFSDDPEAVAYAERLIRLGEQRDSLYAGQQRWLSTLRGLKPEPGSTETAVPSVGQFVLHAGRHISHEPALIRFHPFQPHLVVADRTAAGGLSVYRVGDRLDELNQFRPPPCMDVFSGFVGRRSSPNLHLPETQCSGRITDIQFLNCCEQRSLLLTAHDDGRIRVWRNYLNDLDQGHPEIVTAWTGLTDLIASSNPSGVVVHWSQSACQLIVAGDSRTARVWDCEHESRVRDIPTGADSCVTTLARSPVDPFLVGAGFGDGGVRVFDLRIPAAAHSSTATHHHDCHIFSGTADSGWIHAVGFGPHGRLYATGSTGAVSAWHLTAAQKPPELPARTASAPRLKKSASSTGLRFDRLSFPPRLGTSVLFNATVQCAALKVDLDHSASTHFVVAGLAGLTTNQLAMHRIEDGTVYATYRHHRNLTPLSVAVHPIQPSVAVGYNDNSVILLNVESKPGSSK